MKALCVDSASSRMTVSAKNEEDCISLTLDIGPSQSQELLPAIDYVLNKTGLKPQDLDYMALCKGPGTFTGLRLAFAALKAIELAFNKPVYGISTLECYAYPFKDFNGQVITTIDAKKNQFFAAIFEKGKPVMKEEDTSVEKVLSQLNKEKPVLCAGPDGALFKETLKKACPELNVISFNLQENPCISLFEMAEKLISENAQPLKDFDGPEYLRKSEAELALEAKNS